MKKEMVYKKQYKLSFIGLVSELPNFIAMLVSAFLSNSLLVWLDVIDGLINVTNIGFVIAVSKKLAKNLKYQYNYGVEKIEALSALLIGSFEIFSMLIIIFLSLTQIIHPSRPSGLLLLPILIKIIRVLSDYMFFTKQKRLKNYANTKIMQSEYAASIKKIMFDSVTLVSIFICWVFRNFRISWYFSPVICIMIAIYIVYHSVLSMRKAISELTEKTLAEEEQMKILKCLSEFYSEYTELVSVNSLVRGDTNYIELHLKFAPEMTFGQIEDFKKRFSESLNEKMTDSKIKIAI